MTPPSLRGIVVCYQYDDLLRVTLPRNMRHMSECVVVTHPNDEATKAVVAEVPGASVFETDAFFRNGAKFNKGLAMEEGLDALGREGWIVIWDADTLWPDHMPLPPLENECLYTPRRRILEDPRRWTPSFDWSQLPIRHDLEFAGYFQLFSAECSRLRSLPWYGTDWTHAGGCDSVFQARWPRRQKIRPRFEVLHLGPCDTNWFGRVSRRIDGQRIEEARERRHTMEKFLRFKGWGRRRSVRSFQERIELPPDVVDPPSEGDVSDPLK